MEENTKIVPPPVLDHKGLLRNQFRGVKFPVLPTVYDDALSYYDALQKLYDAVNQALQYLYDLSDEVKDVANDYTDQRIAWLQQLLLKDINNLDDKYENLYNDIALTTSQLSVKVNLLYQAWDSYQGFIDFKLRVMMTDLKNYVDSLLIESYPVYVINPVTGNMSTIQVAIDDIWAKFNAGALTAEEYDSLHMTAADYDNMLITAIRYDSSARWIFFHSLYLRMPSPFDGTIRTYEFIINHLADLHKDALFAEEYDGLMLTASAYDDKKLTAYDYDWRGKSLLDD